MRPDLKDTPPASHTLADLTRCVLHHRDERHWKQFHTPKELAVSLCVEAAELLAIMQWKTGAELEQAIAARRGHVADELADVLHSLLLLADDVGVELGQALYDKLAKDAVKYPVQKARGKNLKYDEL